MERRVPDRTRGKAKCIITATSASSSSSLISVISIYPVSWRARLSSDIPKEGWGLLVRIRCFFDPFFSSVCQEQDAVAVRARLSGLDSRGGSRLQDSEWRENCLSLWVDVLQVLDSISSNAKCSTTDKREAWWMPVSTSVQWCVKSLIQVLQCFGSCCPIGPKAFFSHAKNDASFNDHELKWSDLCLPSDLLGLRYKHAYVSPWPISDSYDHTLLGRILKNYMAPENEREMIRSRHKCLENVKELEEPCGIQ